MMHFRTDPPLSQEHNERPAFGSTFTAQFA
jgi:hypothetical protein